MRPGSEFIHIKADIHRAPAPMIAKLPIGNLAVKVQHLVGPFYFLTSVLTVPECRLRRSSRSNNRVQPHCLAAFHISRRTSLAQYSTSARSAASRPRLDHCPLGQRSALAL